MDKHVYWEQWDEETNKVKTCCIYRPENSIHVPAKIGQLKHGDRVYLLQVITPQAINSILERIDKIETFLVIE